MAYWLHQWQGIYRFNLYNECNLLLSVTSFLRSVNLFKASRDMEVGGGKIGWMPVCMCKRKFLKKDERIENDKRKAVYVTPGSVFVSQLRHRYREWTIVVHSHAVKGGHWWLMCVMGNLGLCTLFSIYSVSSFSCLHNPFKPERLLLLFLVLLQRMKQFNSQPIVIDVASDDVFLFLRVR